MSRRWCNVYKLVRKVSMPIDVAQLWQEGAPIDRPQRRPVMPKSRLEWENGKNVPVDMPKRRLAMPKGRQGL